MHSRPMTLMLGTSLIVGLASVSVPGYAAPGSAVGLASVKSTRKTTDPPVPARGRLGQDLFLAIDHHDLAAVQALLKRGADPNALNGLEFRPIYVAAASHQVDAMRALLAAGALPDATSAYGTPLLFAASSANVDGAHLLIAHGADVNAQRGDSASVLMMAAGAGAPPLIAELLSRHADVNAVDDDGATPLIFAARPGNLEACRLLLAAHAPVDTADIHGRTPLMHAAIGGHADVVQLLLESGAKPDARDAGGRTALLLTAAYGDYPDVVRALLAAGADRSAADAAGRTAAAIAELRGRTGTAALLGPPAATAVEPGRAPSQAVAASVKLLDASMLHFNQQTTCVSCHQDGLGRMTSAAARSHGFALDPAVERAQMARINGGLSALRPLHLAALRSPEAMKQVPLIEINEVVPGDVWLLAGMAAQGQPRTEANGAMALVLARQQLPDGRWAFSVPRVPMQSSFFTTTALAVRSLQAYGPAPAHAEIAARIDRARTWMAKAPATTGDDRAFRVIGLTWSGAGAGDIRSAVDAVRSAQRPDGGWAQLDALQSDAYATGEALYALHAGSVGPTDPAYARGVAFLLRTQDDDGSWFVAKRAIPANNYLDGGFPHGESQYASFNGTCWATLALLQTIPASRSQVASAAPSVR